MTEPLSQKALKALDAIVDKVLAYKPKPKTKAAKKRKRTAGKLRGQKHASAASRPDQST